MAPFRIAFLLGLLLVLVAIHLIKADLFPNVRHGKFDKSNKSPGDVHSHVGVHCHERQQSPINLDSYKAIAYAGYVEPVESEEGDTEEEQEDDSRKRRRKREGETYNLVFKNYNRLRRFHVENTGGGAQGSFINQSLQIHGSAIKDRTYNLQQFHFHWGNSSDHGSEHYVDNNTFSMEMHLVHLRDTFATVQDALNQTDDRHALVVLGIFIQASASTPYNPHFERIVQSLRCSNGTKTGLKATGPKYGRVNMYNLIPKSNLESGLEEAFMYDGSLTTHDCNEVVGWFVFKNPLHISEGQITPFRHLFDDKGKWIVEGDNARAIQQLGDRPLYREDVSVSFEESEPEPPEEE